MKYPIFKYTYKNIANNKKRTALSILCVVLCISSIVTVGLISVSYASSYSENQENEHGIQQALIKDVDLNNIEKIKEDGRIEKVGTVNLIAASPIKDNIFNEHVIVGSMDKVAKEQTRIRLLKGRYPEKDNEITVERSLLSLLKMQEQTGQKIKLNLSSIDDSENVGTKEFTIVGIINNYSEMQADVGTKSEISSKLPNALTVGANGVLLKTEKPTIDVLINVKHGQDYKKVSKSYGSVGDIVLNTSVYDNKVSGFLTNDSNMNTILAAVFASVLFIGLFSVYSNISINKLNMSDNIVKLKVAGTSNGQILKFAVYKSALIYLFSVPIGLLLGTVLSYVVSKAVLTNLVQYFKLGYNFSIYIIALILSLAAILIFNMVSVLGLLAKRPIQIKTKTSNIVKKDIKLKIKNPVRLWGVKSAVQNFSSTASVILSFAICFTAVFVILFVYKVNLSINQDNMCFDYRVDEYNGGYISQGVKIYQNVFEGISDKDLEGIGNINEIEKCSAVKRLNVKLKVKLNKENYNKLHYFESGTFSDPSSIKPNYYEQKDLKNYGYDENQTLVGMSLDGVDDSVLNSLKKYIVFGKIDNENLKTGKEIIIVYTNGEKVPPFKLNETLNLSMLTLRSPGDTKAGIWKKDFDVKVGAIIKLENRKSMLNNICEGMMIFNKKAFDELDLPVNNNSVFINLKEPDKYENTENMLSKLKDIYPNMFLSSKRAEAESSRKYVQTINTICCVLILTVLMFSLLNLWNIINTKVNEQSAVWGSLRAVGFRKRDAHGYQITELSVINIIGYLLSLPLSVLMAYLVGGQNVNYLTFKFLPFGLSLIFLALSVAVSSLLCFSPISKVYKKNIVDLIYSLE